MGTRRRYRLDALESDISLLSMFNCWPMAKILLEKFSSYLSASAIKLWEDVWKFLSNKFHILAFVLSFFHCRVKCFSRLPNGLWQLCGHTQFCSFHSIRIFARPISAHFAFMIIMKLNHYRRASAPDFLPTLWTRIVKYIKKRMHKK